MYNIVRIAIGCVLLAGFIVGIKKSKLTRKKSSYVLVACISIVLVVILSFLPFENLFITFGSPEKAYEYYSIHKSDVVLVLEGDNSDLVVARKDYSDTYLIIPKTSDGWKIGIGSNTKKIAQKFDDGIAAYVYQYKNTSDYFITVLDTNGGEFALRDDYDTEFVSLNNDNAYSEKTFVTYYAHISDFNSQYSVTVNGSTIDFE